MTNVSDIWKFELRRGDSHAPRDGACLLDAVSWFMYGQLGDHPICVCPVIANFSRNVNDLMDKKQRQRLKVFIPRLIGTVDSQMERERAKYLAWQAVKVFVPLALDEVGLWEQAVHLRGFEGTIEEATQLLKSYQSSLWALCGLTSGDYPAEVTWANDATWSASKAAGKAQYLPVESARWSAFAAKVPGRIYEKFAEQQGDMIIDAMNGVLAIGKQAEPIEVEELQEAQRKFELAATA